MKRTRIIILGIISILLIPFISGAQDQFTDFLRTELRAQMDELKKQEFPPYYMNYRVVDEQFARVITSFGVLTAKESNRERTLVPQIRIGNPEFDNFKIKQMGSPISRFHGPSYAVLPIDDTNGDNATRQAIWNEVNNRYKFAIDAYQTARAETTINVAEEDKAPCFSQAPAEKYYEAPLPTNRTAVDLDAWEKRLKEISAVFKKHPKILRGDASFRYTVKRIYVLDSEGTEVVQNLTYARIMVQGAAKADDGMELPLVLSYFAHSPESLPSNEQIVKDANLMADKLIALRDAPIVDPYTGPAILSGSASGVFFHEIFGHRIEGQRMKSDKDAQTFKKMIGEYVLPPHLQVFSDPTLKNYADQDMNGYYKYDDQGVKAERVDVVIDGKLNDFLMTRTPLDAHPRSNGHARADIGYDPVSRQSNLVVESSDPKTEEELRQLLIAEIKKQGKDRGYFFKSVTGGFTMTNRRGANAFNVTPLEVYEVYADGRPDKLVRGVDLIGTPLSMFSNIIYAGKAPEIFTGTCGAESGGIPVTATSPTILVQKVEMQRKAKAFDLPPILEKP
ncbi:MULTISPECIES: TldD/PmbA family protein [Butyricimonas]|uniref:TldD/PmbA family protein n=1 Tax=Butyricimonas TaxID=574697 RepID=UPI001D06C408|nr:MULTISPECIES: TldD/PmbA family protein [Butyricimonas]MCB6974301.1 TldD/PmbA family protein [Butyricimonas synergistica]MCG4521139.1 TldD/PmbA family protein [Butyricimonas sp. DFI.6.44]